MKTGRQDVERARRWRAIIHQAACRGLSNREFCRRRKLDESQFYWWQRKLAGRRHPPKASKPTRVGASFALVSDEHGVAGGTRSRQVRSREKSESGPSVNCRNCTDDVETGGGHSGTSEGGDLKTGSCGIRLEGGVSLDQALTRNVGTCRPDAKGASRAGDPCQALSTALAAPLPSNHQHH
jgi:hypothetical protein